MMGDDFGRGVQSESLIWRRFRVWAVSVSSGLLGNFVAVYLTWVQFILHFTTKTVLVHYSAVHLSLEEFKNFSQIILKYAITV